MKKSETMYNNINESDEDDLIIDFDVLCRLLSDTIKDLNIFEKG